MVRATSSRAARTPNDPKGQKATRLSSRISCQSLAVRQQLCESQSKPRTRLRKLWKFRTGRRDAWSHAGRAPIIWLFDGGGDQSVTDRLFPSQFASTTNSFRLFARRFL